MNVIFAIVINRNCYFRYLEQLENKMHLNMPKYNNNNSLFENISSLSLSLKNMFLLLGKIFYHINQS
jgi:hypothetical protein